MKLRISDDFTLGAAFIHAHARIESQTQVHDELERVEMELAARLSLPRSQLRRRVVAMLRAGELDEDALVARWLAAYDTAMDYASAGAGPPQRSSTKDDQRPQEGESGVKDTAITSANGHKKESPA